MSKPYTVRPGDNLTIIARRVGLRSWQELYNSPDNASFRAKRPNPNLIFSGDIIMVPDGPPDGPPDTPPTPPPTPIAKADITVVAEEIKRELAGDESIDLEFLARLFESDRVEDKETSGNELQNRLTTILAASADKANNGVTHFSGIYAGRGDLGFRKAFKDPWPAQSGNQVGHFTTGVDMGFRPMRTFALVPNALLLLSGDQTTAFPKEEIICVRLIVGHEQVADDAVWAAVQQAASPLPDEIRKFFEALPTVRKSPDFFVEASRVKLLGIRIGTGVGNSFQDLHLSLYGFRLGTLIRQREITIRAEAALWIRTDLGAQLQDPVPPPPGVLTG